MPNNNAQKLTQGALMAAIFIIFVLLSLIPGLNIITMWFMPLPLIWYSIKYDIKSAAVVTVVSIVIALLFTGIVQGVLAFGFAIIGTTIGQAIRLGKSKFYIVMAATIASLFFFVVTFVTYIKFTNINIIDQGMKNAEKSLNTAMKLNEKLGIDQTQLLTPKMIDKAMEMASASVPSAIIFVSFLLGMMIIITSFPLLKRLGVTVPKFGAFRDLRLPKILLFIYIIVLGMQLFIKPETGTYLYVVAINLSLIFTMLFLMQGISFIHYFVYVKKMPTAIAWIGTVLAIPLSSYIILLGIVDLGFDLRMLLSGKTKK